MKKLLTILILVVVLVTIKNPAVAQTWTRVFTDNFDNTTSFNNWERTNRFDYNSNICQYDPAVPTIANYDNKNVLVLTATKNGTTYKSGHVKSYYNFKPAVNEEYRVSASIKFIAMNGTAYTGFSSTYGGWPAFWTVQENAWPTQGEIDIVEAYSFGGTVKHASNLFYGSTTGQNQLGNTAERPYTLGEDWHTYDEYWKNENGNVTVTIVVDGVTRATYTNATNANLRLQNFGPHNIILNLCIGSHLGIFDNSKINLFTKTMMWVDYVTVDRRPLTTSSFSLTVQAENYSTMSGVQTETTTDTGGGLNVGWIDTNDWMSYNNINVPTTGSYLFEFRVASPSGGTLSHDLNGGTIQLGSIAVPATGGWQTWRTISRTVTLNAGTYNFGIFASAGGWNLNWWRITRTSTGRMDTEEVIAEGSEEKTGLSLYPNPSHGNVTVTVKEPANIEISDANGKIHFSKFVEKQVTLHDIRTGFYIVRSRSLTSTSVRKLIVR